MKNKQKLDDWAAHTQVIFHCSDADAIELTRLCDELNRLAEARYIAQKNGTEWKDEEALNRARDAHCALNHRLHDEAMAQLQSQGWGPKDALTIICRRGGANPVDEPKALAKVLAAKDAMNHTATMTS